jgi:hypothetical protein
MKLNNLDFKSIFLKAEYLSAEYDLTSEKFDLYKMEFMKELSKQEGSEGLFGEQESTLEESIEEIINEGSEDSVVISKEFKNIYKKIMTIIHPDKILLLKDQRLIEQYNKLAIELNSAYEEGDWFVLLNIAVKLDIPDLDIPEDKVEWLKDYCEKKENEIKGLKSTFAWVWFHSPEKMKQILITNFIKNFSK